MMNYHTATILFYFDDWLIIAVKIAVMYTELLSNNILAKTAASHTSSVGIDVTLY